MRLILFGPPRVERDGQSVDIGRRKALALLAYLAATDQTHSRDTLATLFWPEAPQRSARANLRRVLSDLNREIGPRWLALSGDMVSLAGGDGLWCDVARFRACLARVEDHEHARDELCATCQSLLAEATDLADTDFLSGFSLRGTAEFDDWHYFEAEGLRRSLASTLERLALAYSDCDDYEAAIIYARRWMALDSLHEPPQQMLMTLYYRAGNSPAALRQYERYVALLDEELGQPPTDEITWLYEAIKANRLPDSHSAPTPESGGSNQPKRPVPEGARHHLPAQVTAFVGRKDELAEICGLLRNQAHRTVTLMGPGGIGKTRLSLAAAEAAKENFADGVHFVPLAPLQNADNIVPAVIDALDVRFYDQDEPRAQLLDHLADKQMLLVLDNFEHLLSGVGAVDEMLRAAPRLKILATSRERLNLSGETLLVVGGMGYPSLMAGKARVQKQTQISGQASGQTFADYSAIRLLLQHARLARPGLVADDEFLDDAASVCRLVQGMPLAIVLAAGWLEMLSLSEIADEIAGSLDFLETEMRDVPDRQRSMRAVFDKSWERLSPGEQAIFMQLSVFRGDFGREAAEDVTGTNLRILRGLLNKSFVLFNQQGRFEIHELLRHYGAELLAVSEGEDRIRLAHANYYLNFVHRREPDLRGRAQNEALRQIETDFENIRAAWTWALAHRHDLALPGDIRRTIDRAVGDAAEGLHLYFDMEGLYRAGVQFFGASFDTVMSADDQFSGDLSSEQLPCRTWGKILVRLRFLQSITGDVGIDWRSELTTCRRIAEKHNDQQEVALCTTVLATYHFTVDKDPATCLHLLKKASLQFEALGDLFYRARTLSWMALCHRSMSNPAKNERDYRKKLALVRQIGDVVGITVSLYNLAEVALINGRYAEVQANCEEVVAVGRGLSQPFSQCLLSFSHLLRGELVQAHRGLQRAKAQQATSHSVDLAMLMSAVTSVWAAMSGDSELSEQQARACLDGSVNDPLYVTMANWGLGMSRCNRGEFTTARQFLIEAARPALDLESPAMQSWLLPVAAVVRAHEGAPEQALELLALAARHPLSPGGWQTVWPPVDALLTLLESGFEREAYGAIWEHGQTLELEGVIEEWLQRS